MIEKGLAAAAYAAALTDIFPFLAARIAQAVRIASQGGVRPAPDTRPGIFHVGEPGSPPHTVTADPDRGLALAECTCPDFQSGRAPRTRAGRTPRCRHILAVAVFLNATAYDAT